MKKIGLNLLYIIPDKVGGTQTYAEGILKSFHNKKFNIEIHIFCTKEYYQIIKKQYPNFKYHPISINNRNRVLRILFELTCLPFLVKKHKLSLLHSLGYTAPFYLPIKNIVTIHDLNWYFQKKSFTKFNYLIWKFLVTNSANKTNLIITDSHSSKQDIHNILHINNNKINIVYPGITKYKSTKMKLKQVNSLISKSYIFTVTSLLPHKNIYRLLQAFKDATKNNKIQLVIAGLGGKSQKKISNYIDQNFKNNEVVLLGWVTNNELALLYKKAKIFIFASLYEGFGFPILEAFTYQTPVISSQAYSLKELSGNATLIINPKSTDDISNKINILLKNKKLQKKLILKGLKQKKQFTWKKTTKELLRIYNI